MDDFSAHLNATFRIILFILSLCFLSWAVFPEYRAYSLGLILGITVSWVNAKYLAWKIQILSDAAVKKEKKRVNLGFFVRASTALLAVVLALRFDEIEFSTTLAGLFVAQLVTLLTGFLSTARKKE